MDGGQKKMPETFVDDVVVQAKTVLMRSRIYVLRTLHVFQDGDAIILRGSVDSYYHKQLAQELVRMAVEGVEVINLLDVVYRPEGDDGFPRAEWF
jgi:hypothetical protein